MKALLQFLSLLILGTSTLNAQYRANYSFGTLSQEEMAMRVYPQDSAANAVFLSEYGHTIFVATELQGIIIRTTYYAKIKIFNKEGLDHATVEVPIYHKGNSSEKVKNVKAITHNGGRTTTLSDSNIFTEKLSDYWSLVKFTMPDVQAGSIIEYEYSLESPYNFNFTGWEFQATIPKLYSEFHAEIPGNYVYNRRLVGTLPLSTNTSEIKKKCFRIPSVSGESDCEELTYAMTHIPSFMDEDYMTSRKNYLAAISFELAEFKGFRGERERFTTSWKVLDKEFKSEKSIGKQLKKVDYIKKSMPDELVSGPNDVAHANQIYRYIQNHFTWNQKYRLFQDVTIKKAYDEHIGNSTEINIALINALDAAGFDAQLMLSATRSQGFPTKLHPVMSDFNYALVKLDIGDQTYLLDARDKEMPFGMLPYELLNGYGRVMDFSKGSYWYDIVPNTQNQIRTYLNIELNDEGDFTGTLTAGRTGYMAYDQRQKIKELGEDSYLNDFEASRENMTVIDYENEHLSDINEGLTEKFKIEIDTDYDDNRIILNPFFYSKISKNPFNLNERTYPVDFGYPRTSIFTLKLTIPEGLKVTSSIPTAGIKLPNNGGIFQFNMTQKGQVIILNAKISISRTLFDPVEYPYLKEFYNQIIKTHQSLITLEKI